MDSFSFKPFTAPLLITSKLKTSEPHSHRLKKCIFAGDSNAKCTTWDNIASNTNGDNHNTYVNRDRLNIFPPDRSIYSLVFRNQRSDILYVIITNFNISALKLTENALSSNHWLTILYYNENKTDQKTYVTKTSLEL